MCSFNYCPNCKSEDFEFPNHHRFECFDCGMVFYQNVAAAVAVILERDNKILFTVRNKNPKKGMLALPGGFTDPDETAEESCSREIKEEINLDISTAELNYFQSQPNDYEFMNFPYKTEDLIYTAKLPETLKIELQKEEIRAIKWIDKSEINPDAIAFKSIRNAIKAYLETYPN